MKAAKIYAAHIDAVNEQRVRLHGEQQRGVSWGGAAASRFRFDPGRALDANLEAIASYVRAEDVVIDVGVAPVEPVFPWRFAVAR